MNILFHKVNVAKRLKTRVRRTKKDKIDIILLVTELGGLSEIFFTTCSPGQGQMEKLSDALRGIDNQ